MHFRVFTNLEKCIDKKKIHCFQLNSFTPICCICKKSWKLHLSALPAFFHSKQINLVFNTHVYYWQNNRINGCHSGVNQAYRYVVELIYLDKCSGLQWNKFTYSPMFGYSMCFIVWEQAYTTLIPSNHIPLIHCANTRVWQNSPEYPPKSLRVPRDVRWALHDQLDLVTILYLWGLSRQPLQELLVKQKCKRFENFD